MNEKFGKNYFYGLRKSNYLSYDMLNPKKLFKGVISFVNENKIEGKRVLDVGCAFGFLLRELSTKFEEIYGIDISDFAIRKARKTASNAVLKKVDINNGIPYPDNYFNCIIAVDVLEHTKNFEKSFNKIVKKLKKGGYMIVSSPINEWPRKFFGFTDRDKTHISVPKKTEIDRMVKKNNMKIVCERYYAPFPVLYRIPFIPSSIEILLRK